MCLGANQLMNLSASAVHLGRYRLRPVRHGAGASPRRAAGAGHGSPPAAPTRAPPLRQGPTGPACTRLHKLSSRDVNHTTFSSLPQQENSASQRQLFQTAITLQMHKVWGWTQRFRFSQFLNWNFTVNCNCEDPSQSHFSSLPITTLNDQTLSAFCWLLFGSYGFAPVRYHLQVISNSDLNLFCSNDITWAVIAQNQSFRWI